MARLVPTPGTAIKIAVALDIIGTLIIEQMGFLLNIPFYHPIILLAALVLAYVLFRWRDEIAVGMIELTHPFSDGAHKKAAGEAAEIISAPVQILAHGIVSMKKDFEEVRENLKAKRIRARATRNLRR
ncbi:MAG TPA: hypothetical protein VI933_04740 [archaeon]|nr:hypothetical protein [archaeon]